MKAFMDNFVGMDFSLEVMVLFLLYLSLVAMFSYVAITSFWILIKSLYKSYVKKQ